MNFTNIRELSCQETWTKAHLMEFLKEHTKLEIKDMGAWFYAVYRCGKEGAKVLGFRADFDALPIGETCQVSYVSETAGQGHKCGHDGHSSMLAGLVLELDQSGADCDVILIFQHGEEIGAGGLECSQVIEKEHMEQVYAFHNLTGYPEGSVDLYYGACQPASVDLPFYSKERLPMPASAERKEPGSGDRGDHFIYERAVKGRA